MSLPVLTTPEADAHIEEIDRSWRKERPAAGNAFLDELAHAFELLSGAPHVGKRYRHRTVPGVRRVLLLTTRHHIYYTVRPNAVIVLAVWHAQRRRGPAILRP